MTALTEPTSVIVDPGFIAEADAEAIRPMASGGAAKITRSASRQASAASANTASARPSASTRPRTASLASAIWISPTTPADRAARATDEPIRPQPTIAIRW